MSLIRVSCSLLRSCCSYAVSISCRVELSYSSPRALLLVVRMSRFIFFWPKPTELAHYFLICSCVYCCLYSHFNCISFHKFSRQLSAFSICSSGLISASLVLSAIYLFMKVSISPDIIFYDWLSLKHKLTNCCLTLSCSCRSHTVLHRCAFLVVVVVAAFTRIVTFWQWSISSACRCLYGNFLNMCINICAFSFDRNELIRNLPGNIQPQLSQLAEPLRTDRGIKEWH